MKNSIRYIILIIVVIIVVVAIYVLQQKPTTNDIMITDPPIVTEPTMEDEIISPPSQPAPNFEGALLSFSDSPVLDFNEGDYKQALESGRVIVLFFYADWCPICKIEIPKFYEAMQDLNNPNLIGFRVNFNDDMTDSDEEALAREFGVAYQHTKVILVDGERVLKSPDSWEKDRYLTEINNYLN